MAARDVKVFRGDTLLGTHSLGEGEVVTVEKAVRQDQDPNLVNPPGVGEKQRVKVGQLTDYVVTIGVPEKRSSAPRKRTSAARRPKSTAKRAAAGVEAKS